METLKFDILKQFINARDPALGKILNEYLSELNDYQLQFLHYAVETYVGSAHVLKMENPRVETKDLIDPYTFITEPLRACRQCIDRLYDPCAEKEYQIESDKNFPYQTLFRQVMPPSHKYDIKTGVYNQDHYGSKKAKASTMAGTAAETAANKSYDSVIRKPI